MFRLPCLFDDLVAAKNVTGEGDAATVSQDQYSAYVVSKLPRGTAGSGEEDRP